MPAALLSHILLAQAVRQKQVGIGHRGRSQRNIGLRHMAHATREPRFSPKGIARDPYGFRLRMVAA